MRVSAVRTAAAKHRASSPGHGSGLLQRKCACGGSTSALTGECETCGKNYLQHRAPGGSDGSSVPPIVEEVLQSPGQPLDDRTRAFMEPRFGHSFGDVRIHTDPKAAAAARSVGAVAYTVGRNVVFDSGRFAPNTVGGRQLLAHELTHVVQQDGAPREHGLRLGPEHGPPEAEAYHSERGISPIASRAQSIGLQRKGKSSEEKPDLCSGWTCLADLKGCEKPDAGHEGNGQTSDRWFISFMIDVEAPSADEVGISTVGHSYVKFSESNGTEYTYGFYPDKSSTPDPFLRPEVPGCIVHPDRGHDRCVDLEHKVPVNQVEYRRGLDTAKTWCRAKPKYNLFKNNCTTFAGIVGKEANRPLPNYRGKVAKTYDADNPYTMLESVQEERRRTMPPGAR